MQTLEGVLRTFSSSPPLLAHNQTSGCQESKPGTPQAASGLAVPYTLLCLLIPPVRGYRQALRQPSRMHLSNMMAAKGWLGAARSARTLSVAPKRCLVPAVCGVYDGLGRDVALLPCASCPCRRVTCSHHHLLTALGDSY